MARRRFLLLQVRDHGAAEAQERRCFVRACGLAPEELATHNVVAEPRIPWSRARHADALLIGGAGEHSATRDYAFSAPMGDLVGRWLEEDRPFFGSCFGHHFVAGLLGGRVITDPEREEIGTFEVRLTREAREDPVFRRLPTVFAAQSGHHDRVVELPAEARALAHSRRCPNQAVRLPGRLAYTTQFHPEMTLEDIRARLLMYRDGYLADGAHDTLDLRLGTSPDTPRLLRRFTELAVGEGRPVSGTG